MNGPYLGPTLRASRGDRGAVAVSNQLPETTTLHWHGMHLPAEMDGGPHQEIGPGQLWQPYWTIDQPAATRWYHPRLHRATARHVYRGVAGLFLIDDPATDSLPLPSEYGVDDVPLVLQDKKIKGDGTLDTSNMEFAGINVTGLLGDKILVNGTYDPYFELAAAEPRPCPRAHVNSRIHSQIFSGHVCTTPGLRVPPLSWAGPAPASGTCRGLGRPVGLAVVVADDADQSAGLQPCPPHLTQILQPVQAQLADQLLAGHELPAHHRAVRPAILNQEA